MTTTSGGNISLITPEGDIWITPSGVDKGSLKPEDIICIKANGTMEGKYSPSMETPFHTLIYKVRPDIKAVVHAHSPGLVSFSVVRQIPNTSISPGLFNICGKVGYAKYGVPGTAELGVNISNEFKKGFNAVIMENHGAVAAGANITEAFNRFETLESLSQTIINTKSIGEAHFLELDRITKTSDGTLTKNKGIKTIGKTDEEIENSNKIIEIAYRADRQKVMNGGFNTISVRSENNHFLTTPENIPLWQLQTNDILLVTDDAVLSADALLHQEIYRKNKHINSIITTQSSNTMAFATARVKLNVRTIPESWILLQNIPNVGFCELEADRLRVADTFVTGTSSVILENDTIIITGNELLQTFDRLEVAEFSAKSIIQGSALGKLEPINNEQVNDLKEKFLS